MRKQDKAIIWPVYFDQTKTRKEGRRVPRNLAIPNPKIDEIQAAAQKMGIQTEITIGASFPKNPWNKMGMIKLEKKRAKEQIINDLAKQLVKARSTASPASTKKN